MAEPFPELPTVCFPTPGTRIASQYCYGIAASASGRIKNHLFRVLIRQTNNLWFRKRDYDCGCLAEQPMIPQILKAVLLGSIMVRFGHPIFIFFA